jgi:hypothetical protein
MEAEAKIIEVCPVCKNKAGKNLAIYEYPARNPFSFRVSCYYCGTRGPNGHTLEEAVERWNRGER